MSDRASDPLRVALQPAFAWKCPRCDKQNFACAERVEEPVDAELQAKREETGLDGDFLIAPDHVQCERCDKLFETVDE